MDVNDRYFVIGVTEDGKTYVEAVTKETLMQAMKDPEDGGWINPEMVQLDIPTADPAYWKGHFIIIRGQIVAPRPVEKVVEWEVR